MTDDADGVVRPDVSGTDDDQKIWDAMQAADDAAATGKEPDPTPAENAAGEEAAPAGKVTAEQEKPGTEDPWATAPEPLRAERERLARERDAALEKERRMAGQLPGQTRRINELIEENKALKAAAEKAPAKEHEDRATGAAHDDDDPELSQAREDYPEIVGPLEKRAARAETRVVELEKQIKEIGGKVDQQIAAASEREKAQYEAQQAARLSEKHPDWREVSASDEFVQWAESQSPMIRQAINESVDAAEVSLVLSLFKQTRAEPNPAAGRTSAPPQQRPDPRRQAQIDSATTPRTKGGGRAMHGPPDAEADPAGYWDYLEEQDRRQAKTR